MSVVERKNRITRATTKHGGGIGTRNVQKTHNSNRPKPSTARANYFLDLLTPMILMGLAGLVFYFSLTGTHGLLYLDKLNNQLQRISSENKALEQEINVLEQNIHSINSEGFYLEKKAREELGLSKKGETIYLFN